MLVVCDTNVLVSAAAYPRGNPAKVLELVYQNKIALALSDFILEELSRILASPKIGFPPAKVREFIETVKEKAMIVESKTEINVIHEKESDNRILECAVAAKAQALVTGNFKHIRPLGVFQGIEILSPREFIEKYFPNTLTT